MAKSKKVDITEIEAIGEDLQSRSTSAAPEAGAADKKATALARQAKLEALKELQTRLPDLVKKEYFDAYRLMLKKGLTKSAVAREANVNRGAMLRAFERIEEGLAIPTAEGFHVETPAAEPVPIEQTLLETGIQYLSTGQLDNKHYQPRAIIKAPDDLLHDIRLRGGNIYPILVQRSRSAVTDGHRRFDAIVRLNAERKPEEREILVKCDVQDISDADAAVLAYQANVLSSPLSEGERDKWIYRLLSDFGMNVTQVCEKTGLADTTVRNIERAFTKTTDAVKQRLESGKISTGVAKAIASLPAAAQTRIAKKAETKQLSVRAVEDEAAEIRGREAARKKLYDTLYKLEPKLVGTVEVSDRDAWRHKVITDTYHEGWPRESGHMVTTSDVAAAEKMLNITVTEKVKVSPICSTCTFAEGKVCNQGLKVNNRTECDRNIPKTQYWYGRNKCIVCGGWLLPLALKNEKVAVHYDAHDACLVAQMVSIGGLAGKCAECSNDCSTVRSIQYIQGKDDSAARSSKRITVLECDEAQPKVDIVALNIRAQMRVDKAIEDYQAEHRVLKKNSQHIKRVQELEKSGYCETGKYDTEAEADEHLATLKEEGLEGEKLQDNGQWKVFVKEMEA